MAELNRCRITAVLTADTAVELRIYRLTELDSHFHELTNASLIELSERIVLEDLLVVVSAEELTSIVTREAVSHLSKVICTEAEEVSVLSDLVSCKSSSRDLDHCTNFVLEVSASLSDNSVSSLNNYLLNELELLNVAYERDHDLRLNVPIGVLLLNVDSSLDNSLCLHCSDLRICYSKTASSVTHHGVELVERSDYVLDISNSLTL